MGAALPPEILRFPLCRGTGWALGPMRTGVEDIAPLPTPGLDPWNVQLVASRYIDYTIQQFAFHLQAMRKVLAAAKLSGAVDRPYCVREVERQAGYYFVSTVNWILTAVSVSTTRS